MTDTTQWEYKILSIETKGLMGFAMEEPESELNDLGEEGWELVEQINMDLGATQALIFKRPKEE